MKLPKGLFANHSLTSFLGIDVILCSCLIALSPSIVDWIDSVPQMVSPPSYI